jgi:hypothetical protein
MTPEKVKWRGANSERRSVESDVSVFELRVFPLSTLFDQFSSQRSERIQIRPVIHVSFSDQPLVDEVVEVWIQPSVVYFSCRLFLEFSTDFRSRWLVERSNTIEHIPLKAC